MSNLTNIMEAASTLACELAVYGTVSPKAERELMAQCSTANVPFVAVQYAAHEMARAIKAVAA